MIYGTAEDLLTENGSIYIFALGRVQSMCKEHNAYCAEFEKGDFSSVGIFESDGTYRYSDTDSAYVREITDTQQPSYYYAMPMANNHFVYFIREYGEDKEYVRQTRQQRLEEISRMYGPWHKEYSLIE